MRKLLILPLVSILLIACAQVGLQEPRSFDERLAYAVVQVASVRITAADALDRGQIELEDATRVQVMADQARAAIDAARVASDLGDTASAESRLVLALAVLGELKTYLQKESNRG